MSIKFFIQFVFIVSRLNINSLFPFSDELTNQESTNFASDCQKAGYPSQNTKLQPQC